MNQKIQVIKASGEKAPFSDKKLRRSLERSGAEAKVIDEIVNDIQRKLHEGISTRAIYKLAFKLLRKKHKLSASRYKLKKAIMELGPSGFPFEKYIGEIFKSRGYKIKINQIIKGHCVAHEVDVLAENSTIIKVMECKYHNLQGTICDVKIPLYVHSRFEDIVSNASEIKKYEGWVVTNTRFSGDAAQYGICIGLNLLGWDFPEGKGLREIIDQMGLYPITCLTTLTQKEKISLMDEGLILCREIAENEKALIELKISPARVQTIINEAMALCSNQ